MGYRYGGGLVDRIGGIEYAFRLEPHFDNHPSLAPGQDPSAPDAPAPYWHPGVSVWTKVDPKAPFPPGLDRPKQSPVSPLPVSPIISVGILTLGVAVGYLGADALGPELGFAR